MTDFLHSLRGLPCLNFSKERKQELELSSDDLIENALKVYDQFHAHKLHDQITQEWRLVKRKKSLHVYRERGKSKCPISRKYLCSGVMPGTVEDMVNGTYSDDTENMRIRLGILMEKYLDARVLHVFERNDRSDSVIFSGIKWLAIKTPTSASLIYDRDMLFYSRIGRIVDSRGRYFVYYVVNSIELDEFPVQRHQNLERSYISFCYLFRQVQDEWIGCFIIGTCSLEGTLPRSLSEHITTERMLSVGKFLNVARAKAFSARIITNADRLPSTSSSCDVCMKKSTILSGKFKLCMGCRRNTCRKCREWCTVFRLDLRSQKPGKERFCLQCIADITRPTISSFYLNSLQESTSSSMEFQSTKLASTSTSGINKHSDNSLSDRSQDNELEVGEIPTMEGPLNLDGLATFIERASLASTREMQWNQDELEYYVEILRESGHFNRTTTTQHLLSLDKMDQNDETDIILDDTETFFSVDELD